VEGGAGRRGRRKRPRRGIRGNLAHRSVEIVGIDNDLAFADPIIKNKKGEFLINIRNVLYLFPQVFRELFGDFGILNFYFFRSTIPSIVWPVNIFYNYLRKLFFSSGYGCFTNKTKFINP
jgi:hypothetical protein